MAFHELESKEEKILPSQSKCNIHLRTIMKAQRVRRCIDLLFL